ncbi:MAG TPA: peptidoglycan bridge formation glycyltransferase FemA/FemB family protein [Candidatus Limnocylindrales bacterium]|nr:peptidoglycan bridge formation glycyltransferase FemA/FemB family protein [Candidatus Limnocylindrales bacterium]
MSRPQKPLDPDDATAWDAFVSGANPGSYLQLTPWAAVKAVNGWSAVRLAADAGSAGRVGAQVLVRRPRPLPWAFAYAPRGPVAAEWAPDTAEDQVAAFAEACRTTLTTRAGRVSHVRIDPEIEAGGPQDDEGAMHRALRAADFRPAPPIQPNATRLIDLSADEEALWGDLRKKWRQYVNKARSAGITVVDAGSERLPEFYAIYRETADRAGFLIRAEQAYREVWEAFAPHGLARLLFAQTKDGEPLATLFLLRCGDRVVEPYGGMTQEGGDSRSNYLLKWEAIRTSREQGATGYDLWGLATGGIAHFKTGFGGREVRYIGAWDLVLDPLGRQVYGAAQGARVRWERRRRGLKGSGSASAFGRDAAADAG